MRLPVIRDLPQRHAEIDHCKPRFRTRPVQVATGQDSCRLPDRIIVAHHGSPYGGAVGTSISLLGQAAGAVASVEESLAKLRSEVEGLKSGANGKFFYPTGLQGEIQKVASNADGNFKLTLSKGKRVVLAAAKDNLYWLLWIDPSKINGPITLTNNNLNGTACGECVFTATSTPSSL